MEEEEEEFLSAPVQNLNLNSKGLYCFFLKFLSIFYICPLHIQEQASNLAGQILSAAFFSLHKTFILSKRFYLGFSCKFLPRRLLQVGS